MSYQVIARKWRPQVFTEMVGQDPITRTLTNAIRQGRVAHAYLFTGARGVGKTSAARILAKGLNCENGPTPEPCNQCTSCLEITSGAAVDVREIDGASHTGVDDVRELREQVRYLPARCRYKVYVIDEVHMLSTSAFNALLKTLEEPPAHVIFIFATTEPHKIPATIISRCQRFDFARIPPGEIMAHLKRICADENFKISESALALVARQAAGSMRDSQSLLEQIISYGGKEVADEEVAQVLGLIDRQLLQELTEAIIERNAARCLSAFQRAYNFGYDLTQLAQELLGYLRNLLVARVAPEAERLLELPQTEVAELQKRVAALSPAYLEQLFTILARAIDDIHRSLTPQLVMEVTLLKMIDTPPLIPVEEILKRLEQLAQAVHNAPEKDYMPPGASGSTASGPSETPMPTPSQSSPPAAPVTVAPATKNPYDRWHALLNFLLQKDISIGHILEQARLQGYDDHKLHLMFDRVFFYSSLTSEPEVERRFRSLVADYHGHPLEIVIEDTSRQSQEERRKNKENETARRKRQDQEIRNHPLVRETLEVFQGRITDIKTEKKGPPHVSGE